MRRYILLVAVVLVVACWTRPARAQYGFGFGQTADPIAEIEAAEEQGQAGPHEVLEAGRQGGRVPPAVVPSAADLPTRTVRMDLSGHPVPGYPAVRGDLNTPGSRARRGQRHGEACRTPPSGGLIGLDRSLISVSVSRDGRGRPVPQAPKTLRSCPGRLGRRGSEA